MADDHGFAAVAEKRSDLWAVSVRGPDDLIAAPDALSAHRAAQRFNEWWCGQIEAKGGVHDFDPHIWASPVFWPWTPDGHARALKDPPADYAKFFEPA